MRLGGIGGIERRGFEDVLGDIGDGRRDKNFILCKGWLAWSDLEVIQREGDNIPS